MSWYKFNEYTQHNKEWPYHDTPACSIPVVLPSIHLSGFVVPRDHGFSAILTKKVFRESFEPILCINKVEHAEDLTHHDTQATSSNCAGTSMHLQWLWKLPIVNFLFRQKMRTRFVGHSKSMNNSRIITQQTYRRDPWVCAPRMYLFDWQNFSVKWKFERHCGNNWVSKPSDILVCAEQKNFV